MRNVFKNILFVLLIFSFFNLPDADAAKKRPKGRIIGRIIDEKDEPVAGANVYIKGTVLGSASGLEGEFEIRTVPAGDFQLIVSMVGYYKESVAIHLEKGQILNLKTIKLKSVPLESQPIVVTAGKYEQRIENVPASISTVSRLEIESRNSVSIDKTLQYVSGVYMNGNQANIRGSTGWSKGLGSRVLMLLDGVPFLAGDTEQMVFDGLAMNEIERIEVVKGAGSALYGSNAIGGVVNVITKPIDEKPEFYFLAYGGLYEKPYYDQWKWSDRTRFMHGVKANYSRKIKDFGFRIAASNDVDDSHRENDYNKHYNLNAKIQYDFTPFDQMTITANYMQQDRGNYISWKDLNNALVPADNQLGSHVESKRYFVMPVYRKVLSETSYFKFKSIWFHNSFNMNKPPNVSNSDYYYAEFLYGRQVGKHVLTAGIVPTYNVLSSELFGSRKGIGAAAYFQDEMKFTDKWLFTLGLRYDYYDIDELGSDNRVNPKGGLVFKPRKGTALRLSMGTGFRAPSMGEAFTSTSIAGFVVIPNPDLKAERSFSTEFGWRQIYNAHLFSDMAVFYTRYSELIEFSILPSGNVQFQNVTKANVAGAELNFNYQPLPKTLYFKLGYTYIYPRDIALDDYLKYRPRHLMYLNSRWIVSFLTLGADYRFISRYDRVDENLPAVIPDADARNNAHIVDVRVETDFIFNSIPLRLSLQLNNVLQYNYIDQIASIAPIRNYVLTMGVRI
jgi:iron complex outermembrane receptor protein